jgi:predicted DNA-binding mobile mystery protein A
LPSIDTGDLMAKLKASIAPDRRDIDAVLELVRDIERIDMPDAGWLRAIRTALGISAAEFGRQLGMSRQAVADLERREVQGAATIGGLRRAAEALGCDLMYFVVPRRSLKKMRKARARAADAALGPASPKTAPVPSQAPAPAPDPGALSTPAGHHPTVDELARELLRRGMQHAWDDLPR